MSGRTCALVTLSVFVVGHCNIGTAETLRVPDDHRTIQSAIDAASAGDTVLVGAGTYQERVRLKPGVALKSAGDNTKGKVGLKRAETTIITETATGWKAQA